MSVGTIWTVGGVAPSAPSGVPNGRGGLLGSGTNARLYTTSFSDAHSKVKEDAEKEKYENRLADALHLDRISRVFEYRDPFSSPPKVLELERTSWTGTEWALSETKPSESCYDNLESVCSILHSTRLIFSSFAEAQETIQAVRELPTAPFKVLDAPNLRDDFYCSVLAYSPTCHTLAVGLGSLLYGWSEGGGVKPLNPGNGNGSWYCPTIFEYDLTA